MLLSAALAQAEVKSYMIPLSSPLYDMADALYAIAGRANPSTSRPWSYAEAKSILGQLDAGDFTGTAEALYNDAYAELEENQPRWMFANDTVGFSARLTVSPEIYVHTNEDFNIDEDQLKGRYDWDLTYNERQKFANLDLDFSARTFFYGFMNAFVTKRRYTDITYSDYYHKDNDFQYGVGSNSAADMSSWKNDAGEDQNINWLNTMTFVKNSSAYQNIFNVNIGALSGQFPDRAFGAFGGDSWYVTIGRERYNWGTRTSRTS